MSQLLLSTAADSDSNQLLLKLPHGLQEMTRPASDIVSRSIITASFNSEERFDWLPRTGLRVSIPDSFTFVPYERATTAELRNRLVSDRKATNSLPGRSLAWWFAQLVHYGLPITIDEERAQQSLRFAIQRDRLAVPLRLRELECKLSELYVSFTPGIDNVKSEANGDADDTLIAMVKKEVDNENKALRSRRSIIRNLEPQFAGNKAGLIHNNILIDCQDDNSCCNSISSSDLTDLQDRNVGQSSNAFSSQEKSKARSNSHRSLQKGNTQRVHEHLKHATIQNSPAGEDTLPKDATSYSDGKKRVPHQDISKTFENSSSNLDSAKRNHPNISFTGATTMDKPISDCVTEDDDDDSVVFSIPSKTRGRRQDESDSDSIVMLSDLRPRNMINKSQRESGKTKTVKPKRKNDPQERIKCKSKLDESDSHNDAESIRLKSCEEFPPSIGDRKSKAKAKKPLTPLHRSDWAIEISSESEYTSAVNDDDYNDGSARIGTDKPQGRANHDLGPSREQNSTSSRSGTRKRGIKHSPMNDPVSMGHTRKKTKISQADNAALIDAKLQEDSSEVSANPGAVQSKARNSQKTASVRKGLQSTNVSLDMWEVSSDDSNIDDSPTPNVRNFVTDQGSSKIAKHGRNDAALKKIDKQKSIASSAKPQPVKVIALPDSAGTDEPIGAIPSGSSCTRHEPADLAIGRNERTYRGRRSSEMPDQPSPNKTTKFQLSNHQRPASNALIPKLKPTSTDKPHSRKMASEVFEPREKIKDRAVLHGPRSELPTTPKPPASKSKGLKGPTEPVSSLPSDEQNPGSSAKSSKKVDGGSSHSIRRQRAVSVANTTSKRSRQASTDVEAEIPRSHKHPRVTAVVPGTASATIEKDRSVAPTAKSSKSKASRKNTNKDVGQRGRASSSSRK